MVQVTPFWEQGHVAGVLPYRPLSVVVHGIEEVPYGLVRWWREYGFLFLLCLFHYLDVPVLDFFDCVHQVVV